jgi:starvation-inducible DNA-binding protein
MSNTPVTDNLKKSLADTYTLYLKTQNYHWNVTGIQFRSLHLLFEEQYTEMQVAIDEIAERIRKLGEKAPGSFAAFNGLKTIMEAQENIAGMEMVKELAEDQKKICSILHTTLEVAEKAGDQVTLDLMVRRLAAHQKNAWMLKAITE